MTLDHNFLTQNPSKSSNVSRLIVA